VALVGAAGTVGSQIAELIAQRDFSYGELRLFGSPIKPEPHDDSGEQSEAVEPLDEPEDLAGFDLAFLAVPLVKAQEIIAAAPGPVLIDLSAANRLPDAASPLVAPGLTARERIHELKSTKVFGVPHPAAQVIASVLSAAEINVGCAGATVVSSASSRGREALEALFRQSAEVLNARLSLEEHETQTAFNVYQPAESDRWSSVIAAQLKELAAGIPPVMVQGVQVPAFHGSAVSLFVARSADGSEWAARLRAAPGIILVESNEASSLIDASGQEAVIVRLTLTAAGAALWCVFDAARLAALSAVWIAESLSR
jgi:aspartate-semialdehyde dehydrogenase